MKPVQTIEKTKDSARALAKVRGVSIDAALDMLSKRYDFPNWHYYLRFYEYFESILTAFPPLKNNTSIATKIARLHVRHEILLSAANIYVARPPKDVKKKTDLLNYLRLYKRDHKRALTSIENLKMVNKHTLYARLEIISIAPDGVLQKIESQLLNDPHVIKILEREKHEPQKNANVRPSASKQRFVSEFHDREDVEYMSIGHLKFKIEK